MMTLTPCQAIAALGEIKKHGGSYDYDYAIRYVELTGIVPEWLRNLRAGAYIVRHCGQTHEVMAVSAADAVNCVRYRLYGATPEAELEPFDAWCPAEVVAGVCRASRINESRMVDEASHETDLFGRRRLGKADAMARLVRMRRVR